MNGISKRQQVLGLAGCLGLCFFASSVGAIASIQAKSFYGQLSQPAWAPPSWLFGPVWSTLYAMMAIAAWLVWREGRFPANRKALSLFLVQLLVNSLWSWLFFAWHLGGLAFADILFLWLLIVATIIYFWRASAMAGALLIPYLLWVSFATVLNYSIWQLNPRML